MAWRLVHYLAHIMVAMATVIHTMRAMAMIIRTMMAMATVIRMAEVTVIKKSFISLN